MVLYWNLERGLTAQYKGAIMGLQEWDKFITKFPQYKDRTPKFLFVSELDWHRDWERGTFDIYCKYLDSNSDFHKIAEKSELPVAKMESALLKAKQKLIHASDAKASEAIYLEMFDSFYRIHPRFWEGFNLVSADPFSGFLYHNFNMINHYCFTIEYPKNPAYEALAVFHVRKKNISEFSVSKFRNLIDSYRTDDVTDYFRKVSELVPQIKRLQQERLKNREVMSLFSMLGNHIFWQNPELVSSSEVRKILIGLNECFEIEFIPYTKFSGAKDMLRCRGVFRDRNKLYLLIGEKRGCRDMLLVELNSRLECLKTMKILQMPWIEDFPAYESAYRNYRIDMNDDWIAIGGKDRILVINRKTGVQNTITDQWGDWNLNGLALCGNRIYFSATEKRFGIHGKVMMKSVSVDGTEQKIFFHSSRAEKNSIFDSIENGMISGFYRMNSGKIFFKLDSYRKVRDGEYRCVYAKLVLFDPATEKFRELQFNGALPYCIEWCKEIDGKMQIAEGVFAKYMCQIDPESAEWEIPFSNDENIANYKPEFYLDGISAARPHFFMDGTDLWCGGETTCFIDLSEPEKSPMLFISPYTLDIEKLDGHIFYFDYLHLIKIKKKVAAR